MNRGVIIYAFKKPAYGKLAWNLAVSIKRHNPDLPIAVIHDDTALSHLEEWRMNYFDHKIKINKEDLYHEEKFSPGKAKLSGYKYFPFDENLIIDADSICIQPLDLIFDVAAKKNIYAQVCSVVNHESEYWNCQWMPLNHVKEAFPLPEKYLLFEINSSFMLVKKSEEAEAFYAKAIENFLTGNDHEKLHKWGGGFPDELAFNVAFAQCGVQPHFDNQQLLELSNDTQWPIFFSTRCTNNWGFIHSGYHFIGYFGDRRFTDKSLQDHYDRIMVGNGAHFGFSHYYKMHLLMKEKHVLTK